VDSATLEGRVDVRLGWDGERITAVDLSSSRPVGTSRVLIGRDAGEALELVPRLFSLCGRAQAQAARAAVDAARGVAVGDATVATRHIAAEGLVDGLWRLLHDLPRLLDEVPLLAPLATLRQALATPGSHYEALLVAADDLFATVLFGRGGLPGNLDGYREWLAEGVTPMAGWLARIDADGLGEWGRCSTPLMPAEPLADDLASLAGRLVSEPGFAMRPDWSGRPVETGALAAQQHQPLVRQLRQGDGHSLATRLAARLAEIERFAGVLHGAQAASLCGGLPLDGGSGLGWAWTARGLLLHVVALDGDEKIVDYRILAPTEWNFHPAGALVRGLEAQPERNEVRLRRGVALAVLALDPCVGHAIEVVTDSVAAEPA